jgi:hypothetical protein
MSSRHVLSFAVAMLVPLHVHAAETLWTEVVVRVYDTSGASSAERRAALDVAASIVSAASVEVVWRPCEGRARNPDACAAPLASGELALRLVRSYTSDDYRRELPLGDALIDTAAGAGVLATIYVDRVDWMAAHGGVDRHALLGRAIAHELGHLLMATSAHGTSGLMRSVWSRSEIRRGQKTDWIFGAREIVAIHARATSRSDAGVISRTGVP